MNTCKLHQIYYSSESFVALDSGFSPLDNCAGRSDLMEYWPIRNYFLNNPVGEKELVGFFSPRFYEKTGLTAKEVHAHIEKNPGKDVYLFNPYFHLAAWHQNIFSQAENSHPGICTTLNEILNLLEININVEKLIMSSNETVYSNYFVANLRFWKSWLTLGEFIFQLSEENKGHIGENLNKNTHYVRGSMPLKIFIIERLASLLLCSKDSWKSSTKYLFKNMQFRSEKPIAFSEEMHQLDSLKIAYNATGHERYLETFFHQKKRITQTYGLVI